MRGGPAAGSIEEYLAAAPEEMRAALEDLRGMIRAAAPDAIEGISYGVPAFKYRGRPLVSLGAAKNHCAFYVQSPAVMEAHAAALAGYDTAKGTVRFLPAEPLPEALVRQLVNARIAEVDAAEEVRIAKKRGA